MLETKEQKEIFIGSIALVLILALVTACSKPTVNTPPRQNTQQANQNLLQSQAYLNYLKALKVDPVASSQLYQQLLTQDDIKQEVDSTLQTNQPVNPPKIDTSKLNVTTDSGATAVSQYLSDSVGQALAFNQNTDTLNPTIFQASSNVPDAVRSELSTLQDQLTKVAVPQEAVTLHKDLLSSLASYQNLLTSATQYVTSQNTEPWPQVYQAYESAQLTGFAYKNDLNKLANKYKISEIPVNVHLADGSSAKGSFLIPRAQAFLGIGDQTFSIVIGNIPEQILKGIMDGFLSSFSSFMVSFLQKMITKIETNYKISNFLYYTDALVSTQYGQDYLAKYVPDALDQKIIKQFIPQFSCGSQNGTALDQVFKAKAAATLGFDPATLDPSDPNYYSKLANVGNFLSSPQGWNTYYQDLASQAQSAAEQAANQELTSSGIKDPRGALDGSIQTSVASLVNTEQAALKGIIDTALNTSTNPISSGIAQLTSSVLNQFVFVGATQNNGSGGVSVLKEQPTCMAAGQLNPIVPPPATGYTPPPPPPSQQAVLAQNCASLDTLSDTCTVTVLAELQACISKTADPFTNCAQLTNSTYVGAMSGSCTPPNTADQAAQCRLNPQYCNQSQGGTATASSTASSTPVSSLSPDQCSQLKTILTPKQ